MLKIICWIGVIAAIVNVFMFGHLAYTYETEGYGLHPLLCEITIITMIACAAYCYAKARS